MALTPVTEASFQSEVLEAEGVVLVDFWATWCGPCRVLHPILEEIDGERDDLKIVSIDIDENAGIAQRYDVLSIPTMILFRDGQMVDRFVGSMPKRRLMKQLEPVLAA
jgi:thioredoxin 1